MSGFANAGGLAASPLSVAPGCGVVVLGVAAAVVVVAAVVESVALVKPVADSFACADEGAAKPVVAFPFVASGASVAALRDASTAAVGSVNPLGDFPVVPSAAARPPSLAAAVPIVVVPVAMALPAFVGKGGGVSAAAVDELAAMAAAAIASGAVALVGVDGAAFAFACCGPEGIAVATAITIATGVLMSLVCVVIVVSVTGLVLAEFLSVDLSSPGFEVASFATAGGLLLAADFPATGLVAAGGGAESTGASFEAPALGLELPLLDEGELVGGVAMLGGVVGCDADGSGAGAGAGALEESAGKLLSTSAAKMPVADDGSGRAAFGGAA